MNKQILAALVLSVLTPLAMAANTSNSNGEYTEYPLDVQRTQTAQLQTAQGAATNIRVTETNRADTAYGKQTARTDVTAKWGHSSAENGEWTTYPAPGY